MEFIHQFIDLFLHLDHHIGELIAHYQHFTYVILFIIIFCETGLVITPFLPGDSLLFILGAFAARGDLNGLLLFALLTVAAILGDTVNYGVGSMLRNRVLNKQRIPLIKQHHLDKTAAFFAKYGNKTIVLARFVPLVRTFAPFMAGVGTMSYGTFITYNIIGAVVWVAIGLGAGYLFGNLPWVEKNFSLVVLGVVVLSIVPIVLEFLKDKKHR